MKEASISKYILFAVTFHALLFLYVYPQMAQLVANAMKVLQACIYKSVNKGLFFNWLVVKSIVKLIMLMVKRLSIL